MPTNPASSIPGADQFGMPGKALVTRETKEEEAETFRPEASLPPIIHSDPNRSKMGRIQTDPIGIEQIIDIRLVVVLERSLDVVVDRLGEKMGALMETRQEVDPGRGRVPNSTTNLEEIEYDSNSERGATLFSEEDPSDEAFFVAGGDGEAEYHEDDNLFIAIVFLN
ncbi:hypothetical protein CRG98_047732 [Punica granatum]|uniref:Uncharacterized protein n=1 Tax=Punica granatum TaxID=22663 RepID=A0A2I0HJL1_PUNGR|nr:hypothetical protein CRG98_047732 [Punica granatum]